jgi:hypothetical protein
MRVRNRLCRLERSLGGGWGRDPDRIVCLYGNDAGETTHLQLADGRVCPAPADMSTVRLPNPCRVYVGIDPYEVY